MALIDVDFVTLQQEKTDIEIKVIYPETIEHKIGFDSVREQLKSLCISPLGESMVDEMAFSSDRANVIARLEECAEMVGILQGESAFPLGNIHDLTDVLSGMRIEGAFITTADLIKLRASMITMSEIAAFFKSMRNDDNESPYPRLDAIALSLQTFPQLMADINRIIDRWGNVKDNASPELASIRSALNSMSGTINSLMRKVMSRAAKDGYIDVDATPSMRDGRLVIPVSPMNKRKIPGIVHDESASGKTFFIEPAEVVEANNRLRELEMDERREITKILISLTASLRPYINDIAGNLQILGRFDFICAKAKFAIDNNAVMPRIGKNCTMDWNGAFHPILRQTLAKQDKTVVPLDIRLSQNDRIIVISGPNAGGKSVTLKTVGIIQYMVQCGILPTLEGNSTVGIIDSIFIDIGDDQSLEDDLSTYSSHLRNMKTFLARGNSRTMILIDEFGAGTEPQIGGAIAQALLKRFNETGMYGVVTTHFRNLKLLAEDTPGLINGSMLYDRHIMRPLFKLSIGNPGSSFAIEIARKTGLPNDIIADAEEIVGSDYINADKYLLDINRDKRYWENKRSSVKSKEKKLDELLEKYEAEAEVLREQRRKIIDEARQEAARIIECSNAAIERTIHDIRKTQADKEKTIEARKRLADERQKLSSDNVMKRNSLLDKAGRRNKPKHDAKQSVAKVQERQIAVGDNVQLDGIGTVGNVIEISGTKASVIFGNLTTTTRLDRLKLTDRKVDNGANKASSFVSVATREDIRERQLRFKSEIDVRGMRVDEALQAITYFIDDAVQFSSVRVRILHGTGTGALRQSIREYLNSVKSVNAYHDEDVRLGGAGITVVEF